MPDDTFPIHRRSAVSTRWSRFNPVAWMAITGSLMISGLAAGQPPAKPAPQPAHVQLRGYLPTLLQKALLENERGATKVLEDCLQLFEAAASGGVASPELGNRAERELLHNRIRVLERQRVYGDSLDRFKLRFDLGADRLKKMEESAVLPLTRQIRRFGELAEDLASTLRRVEESFDPEKAANLRTEVWRTIATAALLRGTRLRDEFPRRWAEWEKLSSRELEKKCNTVLKEIGKLRAKQLKLEEKGQDLPKADRDRLNDLTLEEDLGRFEVALRQYESQPWKGKPTAEERRLEQTILFGKVISDFQTAICPAYHERLERIVKGWPQLPAIRLEKLDLLTCSREQAERAVASRFAKPEAAVDAKANLRQVRTLAEVYRLRQRSMELAFAGREDARTEFTAPAAPAGSERMSNPEAPFLKILNAEHALSRAKAQLIRTWVDYQIARLDFYEALKLPPP